MVAARVQKVGGVCAQSSRRSAATIKSRIGRKPVTIPGIEVKIKDQVLSAKAPKGTGVR